MAARLGVKDNWVLLAAPLTLPNGDPRFRLGFAHGVRGRSGR